MVFQYIIIFLSIILAILLIGVILIQKSKGGGLSSSFASSNQFMGVQRTNSFIEKLTWGLGASIAVLAILSAFVMPNAITGEAPRVKDNTPTEQTTGADFNTPATTTPATTTPATPAQGK